MAREILKIRTDNGLGDNDPTFHDIEIREYSYQGSRMGMPQLSATLMWPTCLDNEWTNKEYVVLRGERYYIRHTPTSEKTNTDTRYKHELKFSSERDELFGDVYFLDVVYDNAATLDKPCSNSPTFKFFGTLSEAVDRLNCAFRYAGIGDSILTQSSTVNIDTVPVGDGYYAVIDPYGEGDLTKNVEFDFSQKTLWEAMTEFFDKFKIPFEFRGRKIIWNATDRIIDKVFKYGYENELLSIKKTNANAKIINRITMLGSSENIPYYYPNETEYGHIVIDTPQSNVYLTPQTVKIDNYSKFLYHVRADESIECILKENRAVFWKVGDKTYSDLKMLGLSLAISQNLDMEGETIKWRSLYTLRYQERLMPPKYRQTEGNERFYDALIPNLLEDTESRTIAASTTVNYRYATFIFDTPMEVKTGDKFTFSLENIEVLAGNPAGFSVRLYNTSKGEAYSDIAIITKNRPYATLTVSKDTVAENLVIYAGIAGETAGNIVSFTKAMLVKGIRHLSWSPAVSEGFNDAYIDPTTGKPYDFPNPYIKGNPHEHIYEDNEEKPTITGIKNTADKLFGEIAGVAFDENDNDSLITSGEDGDALKYQHSFFYIKLNQFNGTYGFNLFDRASQSDPMTIQMTSGACNGCKFKIQAVEKTDVAGYKYYENPVQTTGAGGNIVSGDYASKVNEKNIQSWQQNTQNTPIWICLQKDTETFGHIYPSQEQGIMPAVGDTFNIINIDLPQQYVDASEKRLEYSGIQYMADNNEEKFTFGISFSRIFFAENPDILSEIDEYCKVKVEYNNKLYVLFANTFKITSNENEALPDIQIDLVETISVGESFVKKVVNQAISLMPDYSRNFLSAILAEYRYLNKQRSDRTPYSLAVGGELIIENILRSRDFAEGLTGYGMKATAQGDIEAESLALRRFLEVPELRYNRTEVVVGNQWQAPGAGIVESYEHHGTSDMTVNGQTVTNNVGWINLKLEDGEIGSLKIGDICMGIWHFESGNSTEDSDSGDGTFHFAGFTTVYFVVYEVMGDRNERLHVRTREFWPKEPVEGMHFVAYGNMKKNPDGTWMYPDRQKSAYRTRTYTRYLVGVNDWTFKPSSIAMQLGDLSNLTINGYSMSGYSAYLNNVYFDGVIRQLESSPLRISYEVYGDKYVGAGKDCEIRFTVYKGFEDVTSSVDWEVTVDTDGTIGNVGDNGTLVITNDVLGTQQEATLTVTARWRKSSAVPYQEAVSVIIIRDNELLIGADGKDAVTWEWEADPNVVRCDATGVPIGGTLNVKCFRVKGNTRTQVVASTGSILSLHRIQYRVQTDSGVSAWDDTDGVISLDDWSSMDASPKFSFRVINNAVAGTEPQVLSEFYVGRVCDGAKGAKGDKGDDGESVTGPMGAVIRIRGLFEPGQYYYDGTTAVTSTGGAEIRWLDIVWVVDSYGNRHYKRCTESGSYTSATGPKYNTVVTGWADFSQLDNLIVELLIAKNAHIEFLNGQEIIFGNIENGEQKIWGRIGVPVNDVIMWSGGEDSSVASFVLDKLGKARFGKTTGNHIVIDPGNTEQSTPAQLSIQKAGGTKVILIDGEDHTLSDIYGVSDNIQPEKLSGRLYESTSKELDAGTLTVTKAGGKLTVQLKSRLEVQSVRYDGVGANNQTIPGMVLNGSASVELRLLRNNVIIDSDVHSLTASHSLNSNDPEVKTATKTLEVSKTNLDSGTYRVKAIITVTRPTRPTSSGASVTALAYADTYGGTKELVFTDDYKSFLCANGLMVANSATDYFRAVRTVSGFMTEMSAGQYGLRVSKQDGIESRDIHGSWDAGVVICDKNARNANNCVCPQYGVRLFMTSDETLNMPSGAASKFGSIRCVTLNATAGHHIHEFISFSTIPECWVRRCFNGTWGAWAKKY